MKYTENYRLRKPEYTDYQDIADLNYNADVIDDLLKQPVVTSIGDPGSDSNIPSEAAVRTAIERWVDRGDGYSVTLTDTNTDLGTHLNNILSEYGNKYKFIKITLPANSTWTWNVPVIIAKNVVCVIGQGWTHGAENLTVTINMTQNICITSRSMTVICTVPEFCIRFSPGIMSIIMIMCGVLCINFIELCFSMI